MKRIALTDGSGKWFDESKATRFDHHTYWDGNNSVSMSAGPRAGDRLYRTASERWIKNTWSQYQGVRETYEEITDQEAAEWFAVNEYDDDDIPEELLNVVKDHLKDLEV